MSFHAPRSDFLTAIRRCGLSPNNRICLDIGHETSWPGSGQSFVDLSGTGNHFNRGLGSGSDAADPTPNGVVGRRSSNDYWSVDGGDYFTLAAANPTWVNNIHKVGGVCSFAAIVYVNTMVGTQYICGTTGAIASGTGFSMSVSTGGNVFFVVRDAGTLRHQLSSTSGGIGTGWHFIAASYNEAGADGTDAETAFVVNSRILGLNNQNSGPTRPSGNASQVLQFGAAGSGVNPFESGGRHAMFAAWDSFVNPEQFVALGAMMRSKYGI